jgi:hypothetical protein
MVMVVDVGGGAMIDRKMITNGARVATCRISSICVMEGGTRARGRDSASSSFTLRTMVLRNWSRASCLTEGSLPWIQMDRRTDSRTHGQTTEHMDRQQNTRRNIRRHGQTTEYEK